MSQFFYKFIPKTENANLLLLHLLICPVLQEDAQEEFGWKLVHGDVFRPPRKGMLLSVFLGSGTQIFIMTFVTLCMSLLTSYKTVIAGLTRTTSWRQCLI